VGPIDTKADRERPARQNGRQDDNPSVVVALDQSLPVPSSFDRDATVSGTWRPRIEHPLQPAIHFRGRTALLEQLRGWWTATNQTAHVVSLVAAGGTGKTALIERFLRDVRAAPLPGGLFVWSFYEDNRTEAFLRMACEYFARVIPDDPLACLHHLQEVLCDGAQHLVVLDGIELVQEPFKSTRPLGTLRDPLLKRLLRSIADGLGRARAMITSRFPLPDLQSWEDEPRRHWPVSLESLDEDAVIALFAAWGVRGDQNELVTLGRQLGFHALSIAVLGGYLARACGGDPSGASRFNLGAVERGDPHAQKLSRILGAYANALEHRERRVLSLLSTLPRGASASTLEALMNHESLVPIQGALDGTLDPEPRPKEPTQHAVQLLQVQELERLQRAGLVYSSRAPGPMSQEMYSAHPFVKDYFKGLEGVVAVNRRMAALVTPSLINRPGQLATPEELDRFELLIEHLVLSDQRETAYRIYAHQLGGYEHLAALGEYVRGRRLLELILGAEADQESYFQLRELGHYAQAMGELDEAERRYARAREIFVLDTMTLWDLHDEADDFAALYVMRGLLRQAEAPLPLMIPFSLAELIMFLRSGGEPRHIAWWAARYAPNVLCAPWRGTTRRAILAEQGGDELSTRAPKSGLSLGLPAAQRTWRRLAQRHKVQASALVRGHLALPRNLVVARGELARLQGWIADSGSGDIQLVIAVRHLAARIALTAGDLATCLRQIRLGIQSAETCGFGLLTIDLQLLEARARLAMRESDGVLALTRAVLARAGDAACDYRWSLADAWHLQAQAQRDSDRASARSSAEQALRLREQLQHPGLHETTGLVQELERSPR
jgi:hypothetical protein